MDDAVFWRGVLGGDAKTEIKLVALGMAHGLERAMQTWQPIETVPRDGKGAFLARFQSGHIAHVYLTTPEPPLAQTFRYFGGPCQGQQAGWPAEWMPVPGEHG